MKALIFAAGLGTRLHPLTISKPKALVEIKGISLLEQNICKLRDAGISEIVVNVHHFADQIIEYIEKIFWGIPVHISDESDLLLDTGGGLKKAAHHFQDEAFLLYNVDIISDIDLSKLIAYHKEHSPIATLVVKNRKTNRHLLFDQQNQLSGWRDIKTRKEILKNDIKNPKELAFSGIHVVDPEIFKFMSNKDVFSMIDLYLDVCNKKKVLAYIDNESEWMDVGKIAQLKKLNK